MFWCGLRLVVCRYFQTERVDSTVVMSAQELLIDDVLFHPWNLSAKFSHLLLQNQAIILMTIVFWLLGLIELVLFYCTYQSTDLTELFTVGRAAYSSLKTYPAKGRHLFQSFYYVIFCFELACMVGYFALVLCWCLLGAMLNPEAFLPYVKRTL